MTEEEARNLADLLNLSRALGRGSAQSEIRTALGLRDWAGEVRVA